MKIAIFANTPAQLHFFKNIIKKLEKRGHQVRLLVRDYFETISVARELKIDHIIYSKSTTSKSGKMLLLPYDVLNAYIILRKFKPEIVLGMGVYDAFTSRLLGATCIEFEDSEPIVNRISYSIQFKLYLPFVDAIITPKSFKGDFGIKQIRVNSFKELAYLHPNYYRPDEGIKKLLCLNGDEEYALLRFNAFDAIHDFRVGGFSDSDKILLVHEIEKYSRVFISSEAGVPDEIKDRVINIPKSRIHDVIYYAKILVTDTQTMATEAAILGTPTVRCNHFVGSNDMSNFIELEKEFGLIYNIRESNDAREKAIELINTPTLKDRWVEKREVLLREKIDISNFITCLLENLPESVNQGDPDY